MAKVLRVNTTAPFPNEHARLILEHGETVDLDGHHLIVRNKDNCGLSAAFAPGSWKSFAVLEEAES